MNAGYWLIFGSPPSAWATRSLSLAEFGPVLLLIKLANQLEKVMSGGIDIAAELGDLVTESFAVRLLETRFR